MVTLTKLYKRWQSARIWLNRPIGAGRGYLRLDTTKVSLGLYAEQRLKIATDGTRTGLGYTYPTGQTGIKW